MGKPSRDKGLLGEREVRHEFEQAGFSVRSLQGEGDNLIVLADFVLHIETKRRETIAIHQWMQQATEEAPPGAMPIVAFRRSREPWAVCLSLDHFLKLLRPSPSAADTSG